MEISAWDVYFVMQMDGFIKFFSTISIIMVIYGIFNFMHALDCREKQKNEASLFFANRGKVVILIAIFLYFCAVVIPDTKTLASMKILPIISKSEFVNETLSKEAKELYDLTKQTIIDNIKEKEDYKKTS